MLETLKRAWLDAVDARLLSGQMCPARPLFNAVASVGEARHGRPPTEAEVLEALLLVRGAARLLAKKP
jgi:hypothetical protein